MMMEQHKGLESVSFPFSMLLHHVSLVARLKHRGLKYVLGAKNIDLNRKMSMNLLIMIINKFV